MTTPEPPAPPVGDGPLTLDELVALSRLGWERQGERTTPAGLTLVRMMDMHDPDRTCEERTPGGWRMLL